MPTRNTRKSAADLDTFSAWLQCIGKKAYDNHSILWHYVHRVKSCSQWHVLTRSLRTNKVDWWTFIRGQLSEEEVLCCKKDYLSRFVFICNEEPAKPFIDAILGIEECQLKLRLGVQQAEIVRCPDCRQKDLEIRALKDQIQRMGQEATLDTRLELLRTYFMQNYKYDTLGRMPRSTLRIQMEEYLKREFNEHEILAPTSELWKIFLSDVVKASPTGPLRLVSRQSSLAYALEREDDQQEHLFPLPERKRHRAIDGVGDTVPSLAHERQTLGVDVHRG